MFSCRFYLFCLVAIACICLCDVKKCAETDRQALLKLKAGFINGKELLSSWKGEDCCKWKGITCHNLTGHVTELYLNFEPADVTEFYLKFGRFPEVLKGKIDSSLCELQHLIYLDLSENDLEGKIPECIGSLGQLIKLNLASNQLVGAIPNAIGNLSNLQTLDLGSNNQLVGAIPHAIGNLSNLQTLGLGYTQLAGAIPHAIGNLSNLQTLDLGYSNHLLFANDLEWVSRLSNLRCLNLSDSNLSGAVNWLSSISKLPSLLELHLDLCELPQFNLKNIPHMNSSTSLKTLHLAGNHFNSSIPSWVFNVSKVITDLDLSSNSFQHSIPEGFANMTSLRYLDLSDNELEGSIPKSFQSLCQLKSLRLFNNKLSGQLNDNLKHICPAKSAQNGIESLHLSNNPLSGGSIPDFSKFSSLTTFDLTDTSIGGPLLLFEITKLVSLKDMYLFNNQLNGTLPYTIGQLSNLRTLSIYSNNLNGIVSEAHLSNLSALEILYVDQNSLSFNLSSNWVPPFQLLDLSASSCILGPNFPSWLKHQKKLQILQISNTGISDSFPDWFWDLSIHLYYLNVSHNKLSGTLPKSVQRGELEFTRAGWDLSYNNLSGPLPYFPSSLALLSVSNNMFTGSISCFCAKQFPSLVYLDLSNNFLEGRLLDCWGQFPKLEVLNLAGNNFFGKIPNSFGTLKKIETIHLNNNNFSGEIPPLTLCSNLKFIDFGDNNLQAPLPAWVGQTLHNLIVLRLQANKFHGSIPASLCNLLHLQVLDLSKNNITGKIPRCLHHILAWTNITFQREIISHDAFGCIVAYEDFDIGMFIDSAILAWKGENREYGKNLGFLTSIDLSCNHLIGEIPESITILAALVSLNLSRNNLTGFIPNSIGHMKMLESLDLSRNYLYGRIPASFSNLSFLSYMNLSFNNLSGKILDSTQLQTFGASTYMENNGLCGPPLLKKCLGDENSPNPELTSNTQKHGNEGDDDELISFGFYISLGLGFIIGFWGVGGTLILKTSW